MEFLSIDVLCDEIMTVDSYLMNIRMIAKIAKSETL